MTAAHANIAAHLVHTTDSASRRLAQPERSAWRYVIPAFVGAGCVWAIAMVLT